jgi:hypothetical protein
MMKHESSLEQKNKRNLGFPNFHHIIDLHYFAWAYGNVPLAIKELITIVFDQIKL